MVVYHLPALWGIVVTACTIHLLFETHWLCTIYLLFEAQWLLLVPSTRSFKRSGYCVYHPPALWGTVDTACSIHLLFEAQWLLRVPSTCSWGTVVTACTIHLLLGHSGYCVYHPPALEAQWLLRVPSTCSLRHRGYCIYDPPALWSTVVTVRTIHLLFEAQWLLPVPSTCSLRQSGYSLYHPPALKFKHSAFGHTMYLHVIYHSQNKHGSPTVH